MTEQTGSSLLTESTPEVDGGTPTGDGTAAPTGNAGAQQNGQDGPPEWAVGKFWNGEKYKANPTSYLQEYAREVSTGYRNAEQLVGRDKIPLPKGDDDAEGWSRWYQAAGRPEAGDKYEFQRPDLPQGVEYDEQTEQHFRTMAHVNGLSQRQASAIYDQFVKHRMDEIASWQTTQRQQREELDGQLRREYGQHYEGALARAKSAMNQFADPDFRRYLDETGQGNDPRMIRVFERIGKALMGETRLQGKPAPSMSAGDAQKQITEFQVKHEKALFDKSHPQHAIRVKEFTELFEMAYPETGMGG